MTCIVVHVVVCVVLFVLFVVVVLNAFYYNWQLKTVLYFPAFGNRCKFSRAWHPLHDLAWSSDWVIALLAFDEIGSAPPEQITLLSNLCDETRVLS